jgi:hypothetical protein
MARAKVVTSAGVVLHLNAKAFGRVRGFQFASETPKIAVYGLDSTEPFELMPTTTKISGRVSVYRTIGDGGAEGAAMVVPYDFVPREKYFSLQLVERASDSVIFEAAYCSVIRQSWSVPEKGIVTGEIEFEALDWSNEIKSAR